MSVASRSLMTQRARVRRPVDPGDDPWGQPAVNPGQVPILFDALPCRAWTSMELAEDISTDRAIALGGVRLIVPTDTDIAETDVIEDIRDRTGAVVITGPLRVTGVSWTASHLTIDTQAVKRGKS